MTPLLEPGPGATGRVALDDRYRVAEGRVFLSGIQALVRLLIDQHHADEDAGRRVGILTSGYPGSPLGGLDREIEALGPLAAEHGIVHRPAVNEELGATSVWGAQLAPGLRGATHDGVLGVWYGKSPGVDRASDAIRHGNLVGTHPLGGALALCGDDPECKSSTLPSASESLLAALEVPVLAPGNVQEALDLGRHAIALSRVAGTWAALKVVTALADATATADVGHRRVVPVVPEGPDGEPYRHVPRAYLLAPQSLEMERTLREVRLPLAVRYAQLNGLNPVVHDGRRARLGLVASGTVSERLRTALAMLGLTGDDELRVLRVGMPWPLDAAAVRSFADGLDEVLVLEEKGPFIERQVKDALYGTARAPRVCGQLDDAGARLVSPVGGLCADTLASIVARRVLALREDAGVAAALARIEATAGREIAMPVSTRVPHFCSGCPHSASTKADDDALVGAGIGCHTMIVLDTKGRGDVAGLTQMGGEGAQWIGIAPFLRPRHYIQNLGDGTLHHSGSLAIRAAIAAGLDVTYKILYNGAAAMTGGQAVQGGMDVASLIRSLEVEGVARVVVTTEDTSRYDGVDLPALAEVRPRERLTETQRELARVPGVTVLVHDQACATELRRARKRGLAPEPVERIVIDERVCEGCGDCGEKSGCLSVEPVQTEFGRKTRIHQSSCNVDRSCLAGDCPSFLEVVPPAAATRATAERPAPPALPDPPAPPLGDVRVRLAGIGGTGVVTVSQVLGMAALLDGRHAAGIDQTGLSQKAGPVVSDLRISQEPVDGGGAPPAGSVDVLLGLDVVTAATPRVLAGAAPDRTAAVVSTTLVPTPPMVVDVRAPQADVDADLAAIDALTDAARRVTLDAQAVAEAATGDHVQANVVVLGAAVQAGLLPVSLGALREALALNGRAVERNLAAVEWGRACVAAPDAVAALLSAAAAESVGGTGRVPVPGPLARELADVVTTEPGELRRLVEIRAEDLLGWGGRRAARTYVEELAAVRAREEERLPGSTAVTEEVARGLHRLRAYKDEYEVARLHLEGLAALPKGTRFHIRLHPPVLRALGMERKLRLGRSFVPVLRALRRSRRLRGTRLDPFGHAEVRRVERALPSEYLGVVGQALDRLDATTVGDVVAAAALADGIRGYESIKLENVARFREEAATALARLAGGGRSGGTVIELPMAGSPRAA